MQVAYRSNSSIHEAPRKLNVKQAKAGDHFNPIGNWGAYNISHLPSVPKTQAVCMAKMAVPSGSPRRVARPRISCVLFVVAARGLSPVLSFCSRSPLVVTRARPWEEGPALVRRGIAGQASTVTMQIHPEGGQSPCNIKVCV